MPRRTVVTRKRQVLRVVSLAEMNAEEGGAKLSGLTSEVIEPEETMPDWTLVIVLIARLIRKRLQALVELDVDHFNKLLDDAGFREDRDRLSEELRAILVAIRRAAEAVFGPIKSARMIATDGATPRVGDTLLDQADHATANLSDPDLEVPASVVAGVPQPDTGKWVEAIVEAADKLRAVRDQIEDVRREAERKLGLKNEAFDELDRVLSYGRRVLSGLFYLARMGDIGARFSQPTQRSTRPPDASPPAPEANTDEPSEEEADEVDETAPPPAEDTGSSSVAESG